MIKNISSLPQNKPCLVGESPHWDAQNQRLYWVDIYGKLIFQYTPTHHQTKQFTMPEMVGHVIPTSSEEALVSMPSGIYQFNLANQQLTRITELEPEHPNNRPNDGKCDPEGRLWVGTIDLEFKPEASALYRLDTNNKLTQMLSGLTLANGLAWDTQKNIFYFIDSAKQYVQKFDYHPDTGDITNRRIAFSCDDSPGLPDGMCIDSSGMLWVAFFDGGQVCQFNPDNGKIINKIKVPTKYPTSCALGGKNLDQLFITSASHLLTPKEKKTDTASGLTFVADIS
jgi:sugar lactone lactonase YvrE